MNIPKQSLLLQSAISVLARFAGVGLNFLVAIIITRNLNENEAGMVFMLMALVTGMSLFSRLGTEQWIIRDVARLKDDEQYSAAEYLHSAYRLMFLSSTAFVVLWLILSPAFKIWLFDNHIDTLYLLLASSGIFTFNLVITNSSFLKAVRHTSTALLIQNALPAVAYLLLLGILWDSFQNQQRYLLLYIISLALAGLASLWWLKAWWKQLFNSQSHTRKVSEVFRQAIPLAPVSFFSFLMLWADTIITGILLSNEDVAYYSVAARLSFISLFFLGALDATIYPRLLKIQSQYPEQLRAFFWKATVLVAGMLAAVNFTLWILSDWMLWAFGESYRQAALALSILLLAQLVRGLSLTFSFMFIMQEKVRYLNTFLVLALIINIIANFIFIPIYGIEGAASATLLANLVLTGGVMVFFFRKSLLSGYA